MDGPNIEKLFTETDCLTAQSNLDDICKYLRFFKKEDSYQAHLTKFLPKLAHPEYKEAFDEFIGDLANRDLADELKGAFKKVKVEAPDPAATVTPEAKTETHVLEVPKKHGRKSKKVS